ncbi:hypothetical protein V2J09_016011 [Rumex salicifolius]
MAIPRNPKAKPWQGRPPILLIALGVTAISVLFLLSSMSSTSISSPSSSSPKFFENIVRSAHLHVRGGGRNDKYLYWGYGIDCPGKHCDTCAGLGHQESSLRCALEEALVLQRTFVMPSRMCINPMHNNKELLKQATNTSSEAEWMAASCPIETLYDLDLISKRVPVILDNSKMWYRVLSTSMKLGSRGVANVNGISRAKIKENSDYANLLLINRTASPLAWFAECKDRKDHSAILLPYSFLPSVAAKNLRDTADRIKALLGDYDAIHVRRGDILKTRKDRFGVERSLHPHADRDTRPEFILQRIAKWVPEGRTLYIGSNERTPGFFSPLAVRYKLAYSSNYTKILDPVVENNYQLFMIERLVMMGAKTFINTFKSDDSGGYSLSDDPKKAPKEWKKVVHTMEEEDGS